MTQTNYTMRVLHAEPGHYLTQAAEVATSERIVTDTVYLAANDSPANWMEITADAAAGIRAEQAAELEALRAQHSEAAGLPETESSQLDGEPEAQSPATDE